MSTPAISIHVGHRPPLFHIPHAGFSLLDRQTQSSNGKVVVYDLTSFRFGDRKWELRIACREKGHEVSLFTADMLRKPELTDNAFLIPQAAYDDTVEDLANDAAAICLLLSLGTGRVMASDMAYTKSDNRLTPIKQLTPILPPARQKVRPVIGDVHSLQEGHFTKFCEIAGEAYNASRPFWESTLSLFTQGRISESNRTRCLIEIMLLHSLTSQFGNFIAMQAGVCNRQGEAEIEVLREKLDAASPSTPQEQSFCTCLKSYLEASGPAEKTAALFLYAGRMMPREEKEAITELYERILSGNLNSVEWTNRESYKAYDTRVSRVCLLLLLSMLGYVGDFNTLSETYNVQEELPHGDRLCLSSLRRMAYTLRR